MLLNGEGTSIDHERSFKHFHSAAKGGVLPALHNLGNAYASGKGVKQSDHNAALYYSAGAEGGDTFSKFSLANWFYSGRGMKMDKKRAFQLQLEAATDGHPGAMFNVGSHYISGEGIDKADLTLAAEWFEKSANLGFMQARVNLGSMYRDGLGVNRDLYKAVEIFKIGSDKNDKICKQNMDEILLEIKYLESKS
jgi:TPR repeat protein